MKKNMVFKKIIEIKRKFIQNIGVGNILKHESKSFTRNRKMTLKRMVSMLLQGITKSLQLELDDFYEKINCEDEVVSKQAFSKARTNLDPNVLKSAFELTTQTICNCDDLELYKGKYRLCAIDGSDIALDNAKALKEHFGCSGSAKNAVTALASVCYDPLNNVILDANLNPYGTSERSAARENIKVVESLPRPENVDNLYLSDRGYPSKELLAELIDGKIKFLMRVRKKFNVDFDLVEKKEKVAFFYNGKQHYVRVFKITLDNGEIETLVTNLKSKYLKRKDAGELYFKRWGIETKFDSLKNKLELENMSGRRPVTVYQDFWAKLDLANTMAALEFATNDEIALATADKTNKYEQTTNENRLISKFSKRYSDLLAEPSSEKRLLLFDALVSDISRRPIEVKPDRKFDRTIPRKMKFCDRIKRVLR